MGRGGVGLEGILAARRAPACAEAMTIHMLQWADFIPDGDAELRRPIGEYNAQMKADIRLENRRKSYRGYSGTCHDVRGRRPRRVIRGDLERVSRAVARSVREIVAIREVADRPDGRGS